MVGSQKVVIKQNKVNMVKTPQHSELPFRAGFSVITVRRKSMDSGLAVPIVQVGVVSH